MNIFEAHNRQDPIEAQTQELPSSGIRKAIFAAVSSLFLASEACVPAAALKEIETIKLELKSEKLELKSAKLKLENDILKLEILNGKLRVEILELKKKLLVQNYCKEMNPVKTPIENQIIVILFEKLNLLETNWRDALKIYFNQPDSKTLKVFYDLKETIKKSALLLIQGVSKLPNSSLKESIIQRCNLIIKQVNGILGQP